MPDVEIRERTDFATVSRVLKDYAPDLRKDLNREIRQAAKPVREKLRDAVKGTKASARNSRGSAYRARAAHTLSRSRGELTRRKVVGALKRSGLRDSVARSIKIEVKGAGRYSGVRIRQSAGGMPSDQRKLGKYMNKGSWRHPVMGNMNAWVEQKVSPPLWFDKTALLAQPRVKQDIERAVAKSINELAGRLG